MKQRRTLKGLFDGEIQSYGELVSENF